MIMFQSLKEERGFTSALSTLCFSIVVYPYSLLKIIKSFLSDLSYLWGSSGLLSYL